MGVIIDFKLCFRTHVSNLVSKLKIKLGYLYRSKSCLSIRTREYLVMATFLPILDYGDLIYMNASAQCLKKLDVVYHCALRFFNDCGYRTHHCILYYKAKWPSLFARRYTHWLCFIYKALLGLAPTYLSVLLTSNHGHYGLRSNDVLHLLVPHVKTELGKKAFVFAAPSAWNLLQKSLKLTTFISYRQFVSTLKNVEQVNIGQCNCS